MWTNFLLSIHCTVDMPTLFYDVLLCSQPFLQYYSPSMEETSCFSHTSPILNIHPHITYNTVCPTRYRTRYFFNNITTNEDIATITHIHTTDTHYRHTLQTHSSSFLTQRRYCCPNFVAISSLVL